MDRPQNHTVAPICVTGSVIALKYNEGVIMCTDTLASFGSMARYKDVRRMAQLGNNTLMGTSGEYSDFQEIIRMLTAVHLTDWTMQDVKTMNAREYASYLGHNLYQKRCKFDPLYTTNIMSGVVEGKAYLAYLDMYGTYLEGDYHVSGFAHHLGKPILVDRYQEGMDEAAAKAIITDIMKVLYLRDSRASNRVQFAKAKASGVEFEDPVTLEISDHESLLTSGLNPYYP